MPDSPVTEEDVVKASDTVADLREQVMEEEAALRASEATRHLTVEKATLDAEADRLRTQLAQLKEARMVSETPVEEDPAISQIEAGTEAARAVAEETAADEAAAAMRAAADKSQKENS